MDLFLDRTLDNLGLEFNDGFSGKFKQTFDTSNYQKSFFKSSSQYNLSSELPLFNLFKLHGSVTWDKSSETEITYNPNCDVLFKLNEIKISHEHLVSLTKVSEEDDTEIISKSYSELKEESKRKELESSDVELFDKFITEYVMSVKKRSVDKMRQRFQEVDVLVIDDVQFFS